MERKEPQGNEKVILHYVRSFRGFLAHVSLGKAVENVLVTHVFSKPREVLSHAQAQYEAEVSHSYT